MAVPMAAWRIAIRVPGRLVDVFSEGLECVGDAVFWSAPDASGQCRVEAYGDREPDARALAGVLAGIAAAHRVRPPVVETVFLPPRDWLDESRRGFEPFAIGRFFVHGADDPAPAPAGMLGLRVDAGLAFGTGRHESTAGCLRVLDGLARRRFGRILDMGCGSGILAIAAARLWGAPVLGVDCDATAVRVAADNVRLNRVAGRVRLFCGNGFAAPRLRREPAFDLIVANILAPPLRRMAPDLVRCLAPGGTAILSGFLIAPARPVEVLYRSLGLVLERRLDLNGWRILVMKRPD